MSCQVRYEAENTQHDYADHDVAQAQRVGEMADELRLLIHDFLWEGVDGEVPPA